MRRTREPPRQPAALGGVFDSFLDGKVSGQEINAQQEWQGVSRAANTGLPYDPARHHTMIDYVDRQVGPELLAQLGARLVCAQCGIPFHEKNNIGKFQCTYHPLPVVLLRNPHPCCGQPAGSAGCRTGDHRAQTGQGTALWTRDDCTVRIPRVLAARYHIDESDPGVVLAVATDSKDPARSYLIVSRVGERVPGV